jgi:hypothetical protein
MRAGKKVLCWGEDVAVAVRYDGLAGDVAEAHSLVGRGKPGLLLLWHRIRLHDQVYFVFHH